MKRMQYHAVFGLVDRAEDVEHVDPAVAVMGQEIIENSNPY